MGASDDTGATVPAQSGDGGLPEAASDDVGGVVRRQKIQSRGDGLERSDRSEPSSVAVCAVPFTLKRSSDLWDANAYTTKTETAHGLLRLEPERLVIQWRLAVNTQTLHGASWTSKDEIEPVRETSVPLEGVAGAAVRRSRWGFLRRPRLVVTASDLVAFDEIAGGAGLKLKHPAELVLRIKRADQLLAEEFGAELALALARIPRGGRGTGIRRGAAARPSAASEGGEGARIGHGAGARQEEREAIPSTR